MNSRPDDLRGASVHAPAGDLRMVAIEGVERDRRGTLWTRVLLANGATVQVEASAVPAALKRSFVSGVRSAQSQAQGADMTLSELVRALLAEGQPWLAARIGELNAMQARFYELSRRAAFAGRADLAAQALAHRDDLDRVREALYELMGVLWPEYFARSVAVDTGALPVAVPLAVKAALVAAGVISLVGLLAYMSGKGDAYEQITLALAAPGGAPLPAGHPLAPKKSVWDEFAEVAAKAALVLAVGAALWLGGPPLIKALRETKAKA